MRFQKPEYFFVPIVTILITMNVAREGTRWFDVFFEYLTNPNPDPTTVPIHPVTVLAAWTTFAIALTVFAKYSRINLWRSLMLSAAIPFGATGLFEIIYEILGDTIQPGAFHLGTFDWLSLILWTSLGAVTIPFWKFTKEWLLLMIGTSLGFTIWAIIGFPQVTWGTLYQEPLAYIFNSTLKISTFLIILVPIVQGQYDHSKGRLERAQNLKAYDYLHEKADRTRTATYVAHQETLTPQVFTLDVQRRFGTSAGVLLA